MPKAVRQFATLAPSKQRISMGGGSVGDFEIKHSSNEEVTSATWVFNDADGAAIKPKSYSSAKVYDDLRINTSKWGVLIRPGQLPTYSKVLIEGTVTLKDDKGSVRTAKVNGEATFSYAWGGMAKAWYPHPANWDIPWDADDAGQRALVLMWDLISCLPDEIRATAGGIPIVRTADNKGALGIETWSGAHIPYWHDAIKIADDIVTPLNTKSAGATASDINFISTVLHEMGHAITYRKATWGLHQAFAAIRKDMRNSPLGPIGILPGAAAAAPVLILAVAQQLLGMDDFVTGFAEEAGWWLDSPLAAMNPAHIPLDLAAWLARIPRKGLIPDFAYRPNLATGFWGIGQTLFGLKIGNGADRSALVALVNDPTTKANALKRAEAQLARAKAATPPNPTTVAAKQKARDAARAALKKAEKARDTAYSRDGLVSEYAAQDTLEDIAETLRFLVYGASQLNRAGQRWYANLTTTNPKLKARRDYLVYEGVLPKSWNTPLHVGDLYRGNEPNLHLENWRVVL